jgi:predicted TIM-barrel fold metal-dependent hydrolase
MLLALLAGVVLVETYAVYRFQKTYPRSDLFDASRYGASGAILLGKDATLSSFDPVPLIKLEHRDIEKAAVPVIDVHFHFESMPVGMPPARLVEAMDAAGVEQVVNLGGVEKLFEQFATQFRDAYPGRFILFVKPDPDALLKSDGVAREVAWLKRAASLGAQGIKENKSFGMGQRDASGKRIPVDDARLDPYWELAGKLRWPVLIHTGEPKSFWLPVDSHNERYQELLANPAWSVHGKPDTPPFEELMAQRERLLAKHPGTNFVGAHFGMNPDDLAYASQLLDKYPNYYLDMSSVVSELGRQPYSTRRFFIKYQDRILFGTDGGYGLEDRSGWTPERLFRSYFEFLETENEYIEYPMQSVTKQGSWRVYGLGLPAEVLEKVYRGNALRLIPSVEEVRQRYAELEAAAPAP